MAKSMLWLVAEIAGQVRFAPDAERVVYHRWLAGHIRGSGPTAQMSVASGLPTSEYWLTDGRRMMTRSESENVAHVRSQRPAGHFTFWVVVVLCGRYLLFNVRPRCPVYRCSLDQHHASAVMCGLVSSVRWHGDSSRRGGSICVGVQKLFDLPRVFFGEMRVTFRCRVYGSNATNTASNRLRGRHA